MAQVKYSGPGGEIFPDVHWQPEPGEVREFPDDVAAALVGEADDHPRLRLVKAAAKSKKEG